MRQPKDQYHRTGYNRRVIYKNFHCCECKSKTNSKCYCNEQDYVFYNMVKGKMEELLRNNNIQNKIMFSPCFASCPSFDKFIEGCKSIARKKGMHNFNFAKFNP